MELHVATGDPRWLLEAHRLATLAVELFGDDEAGGFFQAPRDGEQLVARKKELDDHPTPSGNAMLAYVLLRLARIWGDDELERRGVSVLRLVRDALTRAPSAFGWMLVALDQHLAPHREVAVVGSPHAPVAQAAREAAAPTDVIAFGPADGIPLLAGRTEVDGRTAVYLCERFACRCRSPNRSWFFGRRRLLGSRRRCRGHLAPLRRDRLVGGRGVVGGHDPPPRRGLERNAERVADPEREHADPGADVGARRRARRGRPTRQARGR